MREWIWRIKAMLHRNRLTAEKQEELQGHLNLEIDSGLRQGLSLEEANRRARLRVGLLSEGLASAREELGFRWLDGLVSDLRHAFRALLRDRGFGVAAVLVLSSCVAINTLIFCMLEGVVLRPLPYRPRTSWFVSMMRAPASRSSPCLWDAFSITAPNPNRSIPWLSIPATIWNYWPRRAFPAADRRPNHGRLFFRSGQDARSRTCFHRRRLTPRHSQRHHQLPALARSLSIRCGNYRHVSPPQSRTLDHRRRCARRLSAHRW